MKKFVTILGVMVLVLVLAACGGGDEAESSVKENSGDRVDAAVEADSGAGSDRADDSTESAAATAVNSEPATETGTDAVLTEDFDGALTVMAQLALGTVQLEASELAVNEAQAAELLPLWQALQSLSASDTTADIELQAVVKQVNNSMSGEQIAAIAGMKLSADKVTELMESGELSLGGFGRGSGSGGGNAGGGLRGGGGGGGLLGGGGGPGGGPGGLGRGDISEDDLATRRAQFEEGGTAVFQDRMLTNMVVRLLEDKSGVVSERQVRGQIMSDAFAAVAEAAGLTVEELQEKTADGYSLAGVVQENGGDAAALQAKLVALFGGLPEAEDLDLEQAAADWLGMEESN